MTKKFSDLYIFILFALLVLLIISSFYVYFLFSKKNNIQSRIYPVKDFYFQNYNIDLDKEYALIVDGEFMQGSNNIKLIDEVFYINLNVVKNNIYKYFYFDQQLDKVIVTNLNEVIEINLFDNIYYINDYENVLTNNFINFENEIYVPFDYLSENYGVTLFKNDTYNIINLVYDDNSYKNFTVDKETQFLFEPEKESKFPFYIDENEILKSYEIVYNEEEKKEYAKVYTNTYVVGYIQLDKLKFVDEYIKLDEEEKEIEVIRNSEKIILLWDQVTNFDANHTESRKSKHEGVNVLSPTWFLFDENTLDGELVFVGSKSYVQNAHENGYKVWALISDIPTGNVDNIGSIAGTVLSNYNIRKKIIDDLLMYVDEYNLDGINIDFEYILESKADDYIQFLRELYPKMKQRNKILSVDMYVPSDWSMYYNRKEVANTSDYIAVMTYDEHTYGSLNNGPVASLEFVDKGIRDTLLEVDKNKILMGIPFYTRVWKTTYLDNGEINRSINNYGMDYAISFFESRGAEFVIDEEKGYIYSNIEVFENDERIVYEAWFENEYSIEKKLEIFEKYDIAGVALWKRFLEQDGIYSLINEKVNK